ncbi:putative low copy number virion structural protein [Brevibacillus phage SecTim467]|uniref:Putative low copy number virion structural protein n=2 Tax=Jenstvirus jenst TaxID=1982225 RepID=A0A0K2CPN7_9CAUD|nr:virion structural protein [Brevibacillus phage Jenst]ALA07170.1 putative low copy virion structural protein [Brevibacillus phage Jenst]ALA07539.1 putative low copy number virion structural protein [Brevibacillus phage SecTim467]
MSSASNFASYVVGGRFDPPFMPTKTDPYIEGIMVESAGAGKVENKLTVNDDSELLSISVGVSNYEAKDYWNLYVGNKLVCKNIYTKDLPEGMYFTAIIPCTKGTQFHFEFFNEGGKPKFVWVNYQMLK